MAGDLYDDAIKSLAKKAQPCRLAAPTQTVKVDNPLCGDRITLDLELAGRNIRDVGFAVRGCLLCEAAAVVLKTAAHQQRVDVAAEFLNTVHEYLRRPTTETHDHDFVVAGLSEFTVFAPVRAFRSRHRCVALPFEALNRALQ